MITTIFQGIIFGLMIAISIGPAFLAIIQNGITRGFKSSLFMALGISISDIVLISLFYLGASRFFNDISNKLFIGITGGLILVGYGLYSLFKKHDDHPKVTNRQNKFLQKIASKDAGIPTYLLKGFFMNFLNPMVWVFWLAAMGWVSTNAPEGKMLNHAMAFFGATISTVFITDLLKSLIGTKVSGYLKPNNILWINRIVGLFLSIFGFFLIFKVITDFVI